MLKLKKNGTYLLKHFKVMNFLLLSNDESFVIKALLLLTFATKMFAICLPRFQHNHVGFDSFLNKVFEQKIM
jgi:hypothetical protein